MLRLKFTQTKHRIAESWILSSTDMSQTSWDDAQSMWWHRHWCHRMLFGLLQDKHNALGMVFLFQKTLICFQVVFCLRYASTQSKTRYSSNMWRKFHIAVYSTLIFFSCFSIIASTKTSGIKHLLLLWPRQWAEFNHTQNQVDILINTYILGDIYYMYLLIRLHLQVLETWQRRIISDVCNSLRF